MSEAERKLEAAKKWVNEAVSAYYAKPNGETLSEMKRAKAYRNRLRRALGR